MKRPKRTADTAGGRAGGLLRAARALSTAVLAAVMAMAAAPPAAAQEGTPDVRRILAEAEATYDSLRSLRAAFEQVLEVPLMDRRSEGRGTWYQKGAGLFRLDFREPEGDLIVADGSRVWLYYPSSNPGQVIRAQVDANPTGAEMLDIQGRIFEDARTRFAATHRGIERVKGHRTHLVELTPREAARYRRIRVWIDTCSHLVRRFELTEENETRRTITLDELEPDVPLADTLFRFEPPPGVEVFEG